MPSRSGDEVQFPLTGLKSNSSYLIWQDTPRRRTGSRGKAFASTGASGLQVHFPPLAEVPEDWPYPVR